MPALKYIHYIIKLSEKKLAAHIVLNGAQGARHMAQGKYGSF